MWTAVAILVTLGCWAGAFFGARLVATSSAAKAHSAFRQSSIEVASTLQLAIQRERDLVVTAAGFFLADPQASNTEFSAWSTSVQALQRYPELVNWGEIRLVPAAKLKPFVAKFITPFDGAMGRGAFKPIPAGKRPYYCLVAALQRRPSQAALPAALDYCATSALVALRDSGKGVYSAVNLGAGSILAVDVPFYHGGVVPITVAARRAAFAGWMGMSFNPGVVLAAALRGHPHTAVAFRFHTASAGAAYVSSSAVFRAGDPPAHAQSVTIDLHNGWTVKTFGVAVSGSVFGNQNALIVLLAGVVLSLVVGILMLVLGTGRSRALRLVAQRTAELRYQALHDPLTGLPNRTLIMDRIEQLLARSRRAGTTGAALYVDLDEFKNVNDTLGHAAGDRLLVTAAARLKSALRESDTLGRMGGDEFVVLIDGGDIAGAPEIVAERLLSAMRQPFDLEGAAVPLIVTTSIGIAAGDRESAGALLRDADMALYQAKADGKNRQHRFDADLEARAANRSELGFDLRSALDDEQFRLVYQPIYNLEDLSLVGVEALLRWQHPSQGLLRPDEFIPILEQTGQIREVGCWVLHEACTQLAAWHSRGDTLAVTVNVSGVQLDGDGVVDDVRDALASSGLGARSLVLEVTETALMRNAAATALRLRAIKQLGVRIAVDDFGTGYSSLGYLQQLPVDILKIDRMFVSALNASPESKVMITTVVALARDLGLMTIAEGVETTAQLDHLREEHVDRAQGFLFSRPLAPKLLETQILAPRRPASSGARP